jgi:hypothetical protein
MKDFYIDKIGLESVTEEKERDVFIKTGKSMLLIFYPKNTGIKGNSKFPAYRPITPPACIHFAWEIERNDNGNSKNLLIHNNIDMEKRWSGTTELDQFTLETLQETL